MWDLGVREFGILGCSIWGVGFNCPRPRRLRVKRRVWGYCPQATQESM